jgi:hypothetical protein
MKISFLVLLNLLITLNLAAQEKPKVALPVGKDHLASFDLHLPLGVFARSQFGGVGLSYSWSHHRFGDNVFPSKLIGFTFIAGGDYYFGREVETAGRPFKYGGYIYSYLMAGIINNPNEFLNLSFTAGPTVGIYKGNADLGAGVNLFGNYFFEKNLSLGLGVTYKKHPGTDVLWTGTLRFGYVFGTR